MPRFPAIQVRFGLFAYHSVKIRGSTQEALQMYGRTWVCGANLSFPGMRLASVCSTGKKLGQGWTLSI